MTNQQFEEWVEEEVQKAFGGMNETFVRSVVGWFTDQAHAIRNKVLHEAIEALPKNIVYPTEGLERMDYWDDKEGSNQDIGFNKGIDEAKSSLLNLLTKE